MHALQVRRGTQFRDREAENALPRRIEPLEVAVEAGDAQQVDRQREEAIEFLLGAPPLHELADLTADRGEHRQQRLASGCRISRLKNSITPITWSPMTIGKPNARVQPSMAAADARGNSRPGDVRDEGGLCRSPRLGRAVRRRARTWSPGCSRRSGERRARWVPDLDAAEAVGVRIDLPECAVLPPERRADGLENPRRCVGEASRLRQHARRRVFRREAPRSLGP